MKVALLVIDMQKAFYDSDKSRESMESALEYINYSIEKFRKYDQPVVFIQDEEAGEGPGSEGFELYEEVDASEKETRISKLYCNSFWQTELELVLRKQNVQLVVICGFAAEYCVYSTYNGAIERGFEATILQHGIASTKKEHVDFVQNICNVTSIQSLEFFLARI